ncbi:type II toxin-antitoxin system VapC family toxin [Mycobacterium barrassiae]|uniref:type II toxin-antitoxin system VapC family toxin n=1 Tax=Mycobacterium barrassiae TaxID=319709 RepID=UPI002265A587|nr:type II toxin-antitoxin system VapC family toxin [Mycobacterium barrassiae]MCV7298274.1 type II toxin-antitoxin system VapC family toxin [Mycobacterium barrassiae]
MTADPPAAGILDTSVFIADESGRQLETSLIPEEVATTVVTLAELNAGVLAARTSEIRARRLRTLDAVADMAVLPIDEDTAQLCALLRVHLAEAGRRVRVNDLWIAAIAASRQLPVVTQDDDFDALAGVAGLAIIRV